MLGWRRIVLTLVISVVCGLPLGFRWKSGPLPAVTRTVELGLIALVIFGLFEQWPKRLPQWLQRWVLQVSSVAVAMPISAAAIYWLTTRSGAPPFYVVPHRLNGFFHLSLVGVLIAPWVALIALLLQKDAFARHQALAFELARSELERQASEARLHLLQAQVA